MKTPREILLKQHQAARPELDRLRAEVLRNELGRKGQPDADPRGWTAFPFLLWRELVLPSRRVWTGLAAVWLLILAANFLMRDYSPVMVRSTPQTMMTLMDRQKLLNELLADRVPPVEADRPRIFTPKPRTEISRRFCI